MNTETMLRSLVAFDTTSRNSNRDLIDFVARFLDDHGISSTLVEDEAGEKANLWATIGPPGPDGVILSAHTDCVPVDGQAWTTDPFTLVETEERWYGRGTADMKSFAASALAAVPLFLEADLRRPIHLALSYDEEVGGGGARRLVSAMAADGVTARWCVVGEPTSMQVVTAHKGIFTFIGNVTGKEAHSSLAPNAVNAAEYAARLVVALQDFGREKAIEGPFDEIFDVAHTTVHVGVLHSGTALNIVPRHAELEFEYRHLPEDDPGAIREKIDRIVARLGAEMSEADPECTIEIEVKAHLPALDTHSDAAVVGEVSELTDVPGVGKVAYGTEAALFEETLAVPTVVCGPGSIEQAHRPDEFIDIAQVQMCEGFMQRLAAQLATP